MYSAASELSIMQDINNDGSLVTKFSRTNKTNKELVNISGISKQGRAYVRQTVANDHGRVAQKNYVLPEERIMHLLTRSNTHSLMRNLDDRPHLVIEKKSPVKNSPKKAVKKTVKKSSKKKTSPKKAVKKTIKKSSKKR